MLKEGRPPYESWLPLRKMRRNKMLFDIIYSLYNLLYLDTSALSFCFLMINTSAGFWDNKFSFPFLSLFPACGLQSVNQGFRDDRCPGSLGLRAVFSREQDGWGSQARSDRTKGKSLISSVFLLPVWTWAVWNYHLKLLVWFLSISYRLTRSKEAVFERSVFLHSTTLHHAKFQFCEG